MIAEIDRRLESLFAIYYDLQRAERLQDSRAAQARLAEGLQESCLLLQDLLRLCEIVTKRGQASRKAPQVLQKLSDPEEMRHFIETERKVLDSTHLSNRTKDHVIYLLSNLIPRVREQRVLSTQWIRALGSLARDVCRESGRRVSSKRHRSLLKRVAIAAAGGLVVVLNTTVPAAAPIAVQSVAAGGWMIEFAVAGQLDDWLIREE